MRVLRVKWVEMHHREIQIEVPDDDDTDALSIARDVASECPPMGDAPWDPRDFFAYPVNEIHDKYLGLSDVEAEEIREDGVVG